MGTAASCRGAADGDSTLAQSRFEALAGVPILPVEGAILDIAEEILRKGEDARKRQAASGHKIWRPKPGTRSREKQESVIGEQGSNTATTFDFLFESFAKDRLTGYPSAARAITHS
jgi:hypothetical protein